MFNKFVSVLCFIFCSFCNAEDIWVVPAENATTGMYDSLEIRQFIRDTQIIGMSNATCTAANTSTDVIIGLLGKHECRVNAADTAISWKMDEPTGIANGSKFLRDDKTWQPIPAASVTWGDVIGKPSFAAVATTGEYSDLSGKPALFSGVYADLTGKPSLASVATSGAYNDLSGRPSLATVATSGSYNDLTNKPTIQSIQRTRAQTNTSGVYTWTYPSAYGSGIVPIVQAQVEDGTSGVIWNVQLTSVSNTSATVQITKTAAVTILGISVLGIQANPQAYVHFTAVAP